MGENAGELTDTVEDDDASGVEWSHWLGWVIVSIRIVTGSQVGEM